MFFKKTKLANSKNGGGQLLNRNAFTLIELLAIIVILAIIAVITVPIILNIIENSRRGAAKDSAYGYKDSINKWYVSKLSEDSNFNIPDGEHKVGELGEKVEGKVPGDNSWFRISKNEVTDACFQFDEYKVEIKEGKVGDAEKGQCEELVQVPTIPTCPECMFVYTENVLTIGTSQAPENATNDYTTLTSSHPYFLGFIANQDTNVIERAFACGIQGTTPFCLEGYDTTKYSNNIDILNSIFSEFPSDCRVYNEDDENSIYCYATNNPYLDAYAIDDGEVSVTKGSSEWIYIRNGSVHCES